MHLAVIFSENNRAPTPEPKLREKKFRRCKSVHLPHSKPTQHNSYQLPLCLRLLPKLPTTALMISRGRLLQYLMDPSPVSSKLVSVPASNRFTVLRTSNRYSPVFVTYSSQTNPLQNILNIFVTVNIFNINFLSLPQGNEFLLAMDVRYYFMSFFISEKY